MARMYDKPPPTLASFFMDVMMKREERENGGASEEEFDSDSDDEGSEIPSMFVLHVYSCGISKMFFKLKKKICKELT